MEPSLPLAEIEWDHTPDPVAQERMLHESEVKEAAAAIIAARPSSSEMRVRFSLEPLKAPAGLGGAPGTGLLLHHQELLLLHCHHLPLMLLLLLLQLQVLLQLLLLRLIHLHPQHHLLLKFGGLRRRFRRHFLGRRLAWC